MSQCPVECEYGNQILELPKLYLLIWLHKMSVEQAKTVNIDYVKYNDEFNND